MITRNIGVWACLLVATWECALGCNPPTLYETRDGFQPRSQAYTVTRLEGAKGDEPMPAPWGLIDRRELHRVIQPVATADAYDMVFAERLGDGYRGGAGVYLWADRPGPARGDGSPEERAKRYVEQFSKTPLVKLQPGAPDYGCPCALHSVEEKPFEQEGSKGYEVMGYQRVRGQEGPDFGFYLAVLQRKDALEAKDLQAVVLLVAPSERFGGAVNDARRLGRRIRWD